MIWNQGVSDLKHNEATQHYQSNSEHLRGKAVENISRANLT